MLRNAPVGSSPNPTQGTSTVKNGKPTRTRTCFEHTVQASTRILLISFSHPNFGEPALLLPLNTCTLNLNTFRKHGGRGHAKC